jgi:LPS export ABC transporter protein LptC
MVSTLENRLMLMLRCFKSCYLPICIFSIATIACNNTQIHTFEKPYKGPSLIVANIEALISDSAMPQIKLKSPLQIEFETGNRYFPKGIDVDFYNADTAKSPSKLTAKKGVYNKNKNLYTVTQDVVIRNPLEGKTMHTEELHWDPINHKIFTDKFVKIQTPEELITGTGLESSEDFSSYKILKVSGIFPME